MMNHTATQRFALNRTMVIEKRANSGQKPDATTLDPLMTFETELAQNTRALAIGLEERGFSDTELFYQAETAMLAAVDSLSVGKWENATLQMRDALKFLIEARNGFELTIRKNPPIRASWRRCGSSTGFRLRSCDGRRRTRKRLAS